MSDEAAELAGGPLYDSAVDTREHIRTVQTLLADVRDELRIRGLEHDASKLKPPEKEMFDRFSTRLKTLEYGSDEYAQTLEEMKKTALAHHYEHNSHHPEFFVDGIRSMHMIDLIEMLADWKAATMRVKDGDLLTSIRVINKQRFGYSDEMEMLLFRTAAALGWL